MHPTIEWILLNTVALDDFLFFLVQQLGLGYTRKAALLRSERCCHRVHLVGPADWQQAGVTVHAIKMQSVDAQEQFTAKGAGHTSLTQRQVQL